MARVIIYDPGHANERVLRDLDQANTLEYLDRVGTDVVLDPDTSGFTEPYKYWRHDTGVIREMNQGEKDALDAENLAAHTANKRAGAQAEMLADTAPGVRDRALADMMIREINILRGRWEQFQGDVAAATSLGDLQASVAAYPDLDDRTLAQAKSVYHNLIEAGDAD